MYVVENNIYFEVQFDNAVEHIIWSDLIESTIIKLKGENRLGIEYEKVTERTYDNLNIITIPNENTIVLSDHERIIYIGNESIFKKIFDMKYDLVKNQVDFRLYKKDKGLQISFNPTLITNEHYTKYCVKGAIAADIKHSHTPSKYGIFVWLGDSEQPVFSENLLEGIDCNKSSSDVIRWFDDGSLLVKDKQGSVWVISGNIVIYIGYFSDIVDLPCIEVVIESEYDYDPDHIPLLVPEKEVVKIEDSYYHLIS